MRYHKYHLFCNLFVNIFIEQERLIALLKLIILDENGTGWCTRQMSNFNKGIPKSNILKILFWEINFRIRQDCPQAYMVILAPKKSKFYLVFAIFSSLILKKYGYSTLVTINYKVWEQFITFESIFTSLQYFGPGSLPPHRSFQIN